MKNFASLFLLFLWILQEPPFAPTLYDVAIQIVDADSGKELVARAYLMNAGEQILPDGFPAYEKGSEKHFLISGNAVLQLPEGSYRMRLEKGLEYYPREVEFEAGAADPRTIPMKRWISMNERGWYSADMHVHRDPADLPAILLAEELNFAPAITTHVWGADVSRPWQPFEEFIVDVDSHHFFTTNSQEVERIQGGPGAVVLLGPEMPLPFSGDEFYPPNLFYTQQAHERGGLVGGDKLFWLDTFVNAVLGEIDFIEINCNHFLPRKVETDLSPWSRWPLELGYRGNRGFALWMMDAYYNILGSGIRLPLSGGSASGVKETPVGFERVYVQIGDGPPTYADLMAALKQGKTFSTNGPVLQFEVDGREGPGTVLEADPSRPIRISGSAQSKQPLESLELLANGRVIARTRGKGARELRLSHSLELKESAWVAFRAFEVSELDNVFAHTSPAYLLVKGRPVLVEDDISRLIEKTDELIEYTEQVEGFRSEKDRQETVKLYRRARVLYEERLQAARAGK